MYSHPEKDEAQKFLDVDGGQLGGEPGIGF